MKSVRVFFFIHFGKNENESFREKKAALFVLTHLHLG